MTAIKNTHHKISKRLVTLLLVLVVLVSCKEDKKENNESTKTNETIEPRKIEDIMVFENLLMEENIEDADYNNIKFDTQGAIFSKSKASPTYIRIPNFELDLNKGFNVSFWFKTDDDDGTKPQSLIAFADKFSSASRVPFYVYFPGNRVSGVFGKQLLWAEEFNAQNGNSREYYDSFQLSKDQFYFVSVNINGSKAEIYVNSELYAYFENLLPHDLKVNHILIGALLSNNEIANPFTGNIHGLKVFKQPLSEKEIVFLFNSQPEIIKEY